MPKSKYRVAKWPVLIGNMKLTLFFYIESHSHENLMRRQPLHVFSTSFCVKLTAAPRDCYRSYCLSSHHMPLKSSYHTHFFLLNWIKVKRHYGGGMISAVHFYVVGVTVKNEWTCPAMVFSPVVTLYVPYTHYLLIIMSFSACFPLSIRRIESGYWNLCRQTHYRFHRRRSRRKSFASTNRM